MHTPTQSLSHNTSHLHHRRVDLEYLLLAFDLAYADLAGELRRGVAVSLQREGTLQGMLVTGPHLRKGELLRRHGGTERGMKGSGGRDNNLIKSWLKAASFSTHFAVYMIN